MSGLSGFERSGGEIWYFDGHGEGMCRVEMHHIRDFYERECANGKKPTGKERPMTEQEKFYRTLRFLVVGGVFGVAIAHLVALAIVLWAIQT